MSALFLVLSSGCSDIPSEQRARADLETWLAARWPGELEVKDYANTGGAVEDGNFTVSYRVRARFVKDTRGCVTTCCGDVCIDKLFQGNFRWEFKSSPDPQIVRKGDVFVVEGEDTYRRTEHGWRSRSFSF